MKPKTFLLRCFSDDDKAEDFINARASEGYALLSLTGSSIRVYTRREGEQVEHAVWVAMEFRGDPKAVREAQQLRMAA